MRARAGPRNPPRSPEDPRELSHAGRRVPVADPGGALPRGLRGIRVPEARLPARGGARRAGTARPGAPRARARRGRDPALCPGPEGDQPRELRQARCDPLAFRQLARQRRRLRQRPLRDGHQRDLGAACAGGDRRHPGDAARPRYRAGRPSTRSCPSSDGARSASTWPTRPRSGARSTPGTAPGVTSSSRSRARRSRAGSAPSWPRSRRRSGPTGPT